MKKIHKILIGSFIALTLIGIGFFGYTQLVSQEDTSTIDYLTFDESVSPREQEVIRSVISSSLLKVTKPLTVGIQTTSNRDDALALLSVYVPVTDVYDTRQSISTEEIAKSTVFVDSNIDLGFQEAIAKNSKAQSLEPVDITEKLKGVTFISLENVSHKHKILSYDGSYYLDNFKQGAIFRQIEFNGEDSAPLHDLTYNQFSKDTILKMNMTGVTALTRVMQEKLKTVPSPHYFSEKIGNFLADADVTHISNEVSFKQNCAFSSNKFCAPPEMIEVLKSSGVDVIDISGNHNNDVGSEFNAATINQYRQLGWTTIGGGLNSEDAAKPYSINSKGSKISLFAYNAADSVSSGTISTATQAGGNPYNEDAAKIAIAAAKEKDEFVIVDIQFLECYSYPNGYIEMPSCYQPIANQAVLFKKIIDMGADMVVGTQAHQPQTYELYKDKPIYYGLGNLYFDQTSWPGTERSLVLTHYFNKGKLIQTKLSPTVFDKALQTRLMNASESQNFLQMLKTARDTM